MYRYKVLSSCLGQLKNLSRTNTVTRHISKFPKTSSAYFRDFRKLASSNTAQSAAVKTVMAPVDNSPANNMGGFELISSFKCNDIIPVYKYKSNKTGLTVVIGEVDGPVVSGHLVLATEAHDDDGLPHTLEHLVFMGSEKYPYKGVLDLLANRCLASGTNACTDVDNTFYTMETVGSEGFLQLLPIYLDHILYPTLTDSAFITEVHHISGEGKDAGVVYCEMQGVENVGENLAYEELRKALYPGKCGYKSNTGGVLKNLRESTSAEKVRNYHKEFYRPENLCVIITGQVKHADVFKALQSFEDKIVLKGDRGSFSRPWQSQIPPFEKSVDKNIYYPCNDEDNGLVIVGWRGPSAVTNRFDLLGCSLLMKYLTNTAVSPLQQEFVEVEDPYANDIDYSLQENSESVLYLAFSNVPKPKISVISDRLKKVLNDIASRESGIDMQRMSVVINRHILQTLSDLESSPHPAVSYMIIGDFLFGNKKEDLDGRLNEVESLRKLAEKPQSYWMDLLKKYFIDAPSAVIKGIPSVDKQKELAEAELKRISEQIKSLGPSGLEKKEKELQKSIEANEVEIPEEVLKSVSIPSTDSINFHHIKSFTTDSEQHPKFDTKKLPFYTYLQHVNTNFIYLMVLMDTNEVPLEQKSYLPLVLESILECPILRDGKIIPYESIVSELEMDTVAVSTRLGIDNESRFNCGMYGQHSALVLQLEVGKYAKGVKWAKELLHLSQLVPERLKIIATKINNEVAQAKRNGHKVSYDLMNSLIYKKESNNYNISMLRQQKFLTKMLERLNSEKGEKEVLAEIENVRSILTSNKNVVLYMAADVDKLANHVSDLYEPWKDFSVSSNSKPKLAPVSDYKLIKSLSEIDTNGCVTGLGCIESSFLVQCCQGINNFLDPDLAPLLVTLHYLTQLEGPMWRQIRGQGLAYSYNIRPKAVEGLIYLSFYRSTDLAAAYKETKNIVDSHISENKWETCLLESAKSSLIYEILQGEKSIGSTIFKVLTNIFKDVPADYNRHMVKNVSNVTLKDVQRVAPQYLNALFDPKKSKTTVVCHPTKSADIVKSFKELGHDLKLYNTLEETHMNS